LHQIVMNLVTNAAHAIGDRQGTVEIAAALHVQTEDTASLAAGTYARVSVTDDGCGMDEATSKRVFDPFFTTNRAGRGTGLGLSIAHGILQRHGGAITVRSRLGEGTTFDAFFPTAPPTDAPPRPAHGNGQRILIVDDEEAVIFLGKRILTRLGY